MVCDGESISTSFHDLMGTSVVVWLFSDHYDVRRFWEAGSQDGAWF